jgi:hypothetical protein
MASGAWHLTMFSCQGIPTVLVVIELDGSKRGRCVACGAAFDGLRVRELTPMGIDVARVTRLKWLFVPEEGEADLQWTSFVLELLCNFRRNGILECVGLWMTGIAWRGDMSTLERKSRSRVIFHRKRCWKESGQCVAAVTGLIPDRDCELAQMSIDMTVGAFIKLQVAEFCFLPLERSVTWLTGNRRMCPAERIAGLFMKLPVSANRAHDRSIAHGLPIDSRMTVLTVLSKTALVNILVASLTTAKGHTVQLKIRSLGCGIVERFMALLTSDLFMFSFKRVFGGLVVEERRFLPIGFVVASLTCGF